MKKLSQMINEAPAHKYHTIIGGLFVFNKETTDEEIIDSILRDFSLKCATLIREFEAPNCALQSLTTYDLFLNRWGIDNPGDVTASEDTEQIYGEIPSERCAKIISKMDDITLSEDEIKSMFGSGEFPSIGIWKEHHQVKDEIHVTYTISR